MQPKKAVGATKSSSSKSTKHRIFIVDDHPIVRGGLAQLIDNEQDLAVCGQGEDAYTSHTIHLCLVASILYNLLGIFLAAIGWITPLFAAILMPVSSLTVISLALAARTFPRNGDSR